MLITPLRQINSCQLHSFNPFMAYLILPLQRIVLPGGLVSGRQELALDSLNLSYDSYKVQRVSISWNLLISGSHLLTMIIFTWFFSAGGPSTPRPFQSRTKLEVRAYGWTRGASELVEQMKGQWLGTWYSHVQCWWNCILDVTRVDLYTWLDSTPQMRIICTSQTCRWFPVSHRTSAS